MKESVIFSAFKRILFIVSLSVISFQQTFAQYQMEKLNRGIVAVSMGGSKVFVSWRWLGNEDNITFNVYRNGTKINATPLTVSNYTDNAGNTSASYTVKAIVNGVEQSLSESATPWAQKYLQIPLNIPPSGTTPSGEKYTYNASDCSIGDVDGDGIHEIFLKWDPSNSKDNSQAGYTGNVYMDCYTMKGVLLWRVDLGRNIRAGAHYTQFLVYDFDGDGKAEMACKTADGTKDGKGVVIGNANADFRSTAGYILTGPEFLTVFNGQTGAAMATANYTPGRGVVSSWGDNYGNRVDRFIAAVAYLDGKTPSMIFGRGYYTRLVRSAWDFKNGKLTQRWIFDSNDAGNGAYKGQGNHQMTVGDMDGDGNQEFCNGASAINNDGKGLFSSGHGHGDALHMSDMDPDRPGLEIWQCQEDESSYGNYGLDFKDSKTGQSLWGLGGGKQGDIGRAMAADIDPRHKGYEVWGSSGPLYTCKGASIGTSKPSVNFGVYWDGDLQRELLDGTKLEKWDYMNNRLTRLATLYDASYGGGTSCNGTKATPNLSGDLFGDWREEIILHSGDSKYLLIYTTTIPSDFKFRTLLHDPQYRVAIAWQNSSYNQPPHLGYYLGSDMATPAKPNISIINSGNTNTCQSTITTPSTTICKGSSTVLTATNGASYKWFNGAAQVSTAATYTAIAAGSYTVEVTNAAGCKAISSITQITVNDIPIITHNVKINDGAWTANSNATACEASTINFGPHPNLAAGWNWTGPNNFSSTLRDPILLNTVAANAGTYSATYTDPNGCKATSAFILQVSKAVATISAPTTSICAGGSVILTANTGATYKWYNGTSQVGTASKLTVTDAGAYTVEVTSDAGCKATSTITQITLNELPIITHFVKIDDGAWTATSNATACEASTVNFGPQPKTTTGWSWTGPNNFSSTLREPILSNAVAGNAGTYSATYIDPNGCKATSAFVLQVSKAAATISAPTTTICAGNSVLLTANTGTFYKWMKGASQVGTASSLSVTEAGAYTVEVTNNSGCKAVSAVKQINVTNATTWYADTDNDGKGDAISTLLSCTQPQGYVAVSGDACPTDATKIAAGNCGCGKTEASCLDCAGIPNGTAVFDNCNICVGGTTGNKECISTGTTNGTNSNITVIPQPFDVTTNIKIDNLGMIQTLTIISANGAVVEMQSNINTTEISIGDQLAAGLYSVIIQTDKGVYTTKIVKK